MLRTFISRVWQWRHQFIKYFLVGISGLALDIGLLWVLKEKWHVRATTALVFSQIVVLSYNFTLNKYWAFGSKGLSHRQLVRYLITVGGNYIFSIVCMWIFNERLGFNYVLVRLVSIASMVSWNFLLYRFWIFPHLIPATVVDV